MVRLIPWCFGAALLLVNGSVISKYWSWENCLYRINKTYLLHLAPGDLAITPYFHPYSYFVYLQQPREPNSCDFKDGDFVFDNPRLQKKLAEVRAEHGRVILDPILVMPLDHELQLLSYLANARRPDVEKDLLRLESFCQQERIPLFAVVRKGGDVVPFHPLQFRGYVKWTDDQLKLRAPPCGEPVP